MRRSGQQMCGAAARGAGERWRRWLRDERGDTTMLEAALVYPMILFLLFGILGIYFLMYQHWNLQVVATDAVARVGATYKYYDGYAGSAGSSDPVKDRINLMTGGVLDYSIMRGVDPYRYYDTIAVTGADPNAQVAVTQYISERLRITSPVVAVAQPNNPKYGFKPVSDGAGRYHYQVTIEAKYDIPLFGFIFAWLHLPTAVTYKVSACSDDIDLANYLVTTNFVGSMSSNLSNIVATSSGITSSTVSDMGDKAVFLLKELLLKKIEIGDSDTY